MTTRGFGALRQVFGAWVLRAVHGGLEAMHQLTQVMCTALDPSLWEVPNKALSLSLSLARALSLQSQLKN